MRKILLTIGLVLLPLSANALEYQNLSLLYTDAPFLPAEAAGISLLTSLGAVQGNPDGTFRPLRSVNRAEFLKIALASFPRVRVSKSDEANCFPDVNKDDWFSSYVCLAKKRGMVEGYPDGTFRPGRTVNYAEALKILSELYDYVGYAAPDEPWYMGYVRASQFNKTALPIALPYDRILTRGHMARLASAYRAKYEGELEMYRLSEKDLDAVVAIRKEEKEASASASEEVEELEVVEEIEELEEVEVMNYIPSTSHFLMLGERTKPIADGVFTPQGEESGDFRSVTVVMWKETKSFEKLYLVDEDGTQVAELRLDIYDKSNETWKTVADPDKRYILPAQTGTTLAIEAKLWGRDARGFAGEQMRVKKFTIVVSNLERTDSHQLVAQDTHFPAHQTVQAEITSVRNSLFEVGSLLQGSAQALSEVFFEGRMLDGAELRIENLKFTIEKTRGVQVSGWQLGEYGSSTRIGCSLGEGIYVSCLSLPKAIGSIPQNGRTLQLFGNVSVDAEEADSFLRLDLLAPGTFGQDGAVWWTDGSVHYTWVEAEEPLVRGTEWK